MDGIRLGLVGRLLILGGVFFAGATVRAQLSPGDLNEAHAFLEGIENCSNCHGGDQELVPDKCLTCHSRIKDERDAGHGLHSRPEYRACQTCHVEHQGRDVPLIYWKDGESAFDHSLTGFQLKGKHGSLTCRQCHAPKYIGAIAAGEKEKIDPSHTFLGLRSGCTACHRDEHRGQFNDNCTKCHDQSAWKPASGFDHAAARFALTGKHQGVVCAKCHPLMTDHPFPDDPDYRKFVGVPFAQCSDCHADSHKGKLGPNCSSCHTAEGWREVNTVNFDHNKTRYPLAGKHLTVACGKCHREGQPKEGLKFAACLDCHTDYHHGDFAKRPSKGACEECHTVSGYSPARFTMAQHEQTTYPLRGAHQAVPCLACHRQNAADGSAGLIFVFASTRCLDCHKDPHRGQVDKLVAASGCEVCHAVESWNRVTYDHSKSKFALEGRHTQVACTKCHADIAATSDIKEVRFTGIRTDCLSCHTDIHRGQFASGNATDCSRCHVASGWPAAKFDHQTSRFKLDGAHRTVACGRCHPSVQTENGSYVKYTPIDTTCVSCHGTTSPERSS